MHNLIKGFTDEEYIRSTGQLLFEVGNCLAASVGYGQIAQEKLESSHPAFTDVETALKTAERAYAAVRQFSEELHRRKLEADKLETRIPRTER